MYYWDKLVNIEPFYKKYNKLLDIIRFYHKEYDLIYLNHPSDEEQNFEIDRLNLKYFKIIKMLVVRIAIYFNPCNIITFTIYSAQH